MQESKLKQFHNKAMLGIDYGEKVIGLASFCPGKDPFVLLAGRIVVKDHDQVLEELSHFIEEEFIEVIVLGLPHHKDGNESEMTQKVKAFGEKLAQRFSDCGLYFQDETLTTFEAQERMKASPRFNFQVDLKQIDAMSASIILEDFFKD